MPNIIIRIPKGSFLGEARNLLTQKINAAAASVEQIPDEPHKRMLCWVLIEEIDSGAWTCGGADVTSQLLPCMAMVYLPEGVLDEASRSQYVQAIHEAFKQSVPIDDKRQIASSVVLHEVPDGDWGVNGVIWKLPQFAMAAGFTHLKHLVNDC
jgi:phenylpyruvate tautomerase PptA (4-oxalocrotonate tautomerase family)